jgi:hypothetical protein
MRRRRYKASPYTRVNNKYPVRIPTDIVSWKSPEYTLPNLNIQASDLLRLSDRFIKLSKEYQYFKIKSMVITFTPDIKGGTIPRPGYGIFVGNEDITPLYADIPLLPGAFRISNKKITRKRFTRPGRNDDFGKWYNCRNTNADYQFSVRCRFMDEPGTVPVYIQTTFYVLFSKLITSTEEGKQLEQDIMFGIDIVKTKKALEKNRGDNIEQELALLKIHEENILMKIKSGQGEGKVGHLEESQLPPSENDQEESEEILQ